MTDRRKWTLGFVTALALAASAADAASPAGPTKGSESAPSFADTLPPGTLIHSSPADALRPDPDTGERTFTCPPGSFPESETNCGNPSDTINGGCNSALQNFSSIFCGATICGTTRFDGAVRDTDWYQFALGSTRQVTLTLSAEFKAIFGFIAGTNGVANCSLATGISPFALVLPNQTGEVTLCLGPGTWWVFVAPDFAQGNLACGTKYWLKMTCATPCPMGACCTPGNNCVETAGPAACVAIAGHYQGDQTFCNFGGCQPPPNDNCANAPTVTCNSTVFADTRNATIEPQEQPPTCAGAAGVGSVWYRIAGTGGPLGVTTCDTANIDLIAKDSILAVYREITGCGDRVLIACNDDAGCGPQLRHSRVCFDSVTNATYLIQVLPYNDLNRGVFKVDIECACTSTIAGACCQANGACSSVTQQACVTLGGSYKGDGTVCAAVGCPNIPVPPNDECGASAPTVTIPGSIVGYTLFAFPDADPSLPSCGPAPTGPGVWYRVVGNGKQLTASLCGSPLDFDARMLVFCGDCTTDSLVCVAGNDNGQTACALAPEASWCSESGRVYSILITSGAGSSGNFTLTMSTAANPCTTPAFCAQSCTVAYPPGAVSENEPECESFYTDNTNGGCAAPGMPKGNIACGQTVSGKSGSFTSGLTSLGRDTDWFRFTLNQRSVVTWSVRAEFLAQALILNDDCGDIQLFASATGNACQDIVATATLDPGAYNVFVSPQFFGDTTCGVKWYGTLSCAPTSDNGACCLSRCSCIETTEFDCLFTQFGLHFAGPGTACQQTNCNPCPADITLDGEVNTADLIQFLGSFGQDLRGDFNCSGFTDTADLTFFLARFGSTCP